ncbi:P-loop containing nucleoside triphosphate hydrolase protein [Lipomyces kononenkoae]|uniref:P-loop containing nucleoside triphosphate hydrolase protein n=1 Tax=Lipomyces kononenkoae TaxID=34357 RepID=A0ACC3SWQ4_LIPKO
MGMITRTIKRCTCHSRTASRFHAFSTAFPVRSRLSDTASTRKYSQNVKNASCNAGNHRPKKSSKPSHALRIGYRSPTLNDLALAKRFFDESQTYHAGSLSPANVPFDTTIPQVAFAGRTNAGKSALLKALIPTMETIRPSKKPGFTRKVYFYGVGNRPGRELVMSDLPGYGYGSTTEQGCLILEYLRSAANLKMVYILLDSRVLEMPSDKQVVELLSTYGIAWQLVSTKFDRARVGNPQPLLDLLMRFSKASRKGAMGASDRYYKDEVIVTSSKTMAGIDELKWSIMRNCGLVSE